MDCIDSTIPLDANKVVPAVNYALSGLIGKGGLGDRGNVNEMIRIERLVRYRECFLISNHTLTCFLS